MRTVELPVHEVAVLAATRALGGAGVALLLADQLNEDQRKTAGWILLAAGILTTIPLAISLVRRMR